LRVLGSGRGCRGWRGYGLVRGRGGRERVLDGLLEVGGGDLLSRRGALSLVLGCRRLLRGLMLSVCGRRRKSICCWRCSGTCR
jgi:hypothetical protein